MANKQQNDFKQKAFKAKQAMMKAVPNVSWDFMPDDVFSQAFGYVQCGAFMAFDTESPEFSDITNFVGARKEQEKANG